MQIGNKIKRLRLEYGLTQEELADRCELTKGYISQLERDLTSPSIATLKDILDCLGSSIPEFFNEQKTDQIVFKAKDIFVKDVEDKGYRIKWIVPNAQKMEMEPIILELMENGEVDEDNPHQGEEFGYVLSGSIILTVGKERHKVKKGECFHYKTNYPHSIKNFGKKQAQVLWISTPPNF
ncbi:MAG: XRE family transcriptional regulator [Bacillota bacterium]|jgi:transcriptional regulator with XRE-family HTH domain|nr:XRE family transcriptional regulator [Bacillota bacterium]NLV63823.1 cupin domain-containing protein [Clostridiaceae bacterium]